MKTAQYYYNEANKLRDDYLQFGISDEEYFEALSKFKGNSDEAKQEVIRLYEKVIELNPNFADAYADLGCLCDNFNDRDEYFEKALSIVPENEILYYKIGYHYLQLGEEEKSIANFNRGIEL
jgi:tetratricopeptide (TPR) repeat protein